MNLNIKGQDDSWTWKTERREHEYTAITRVISEHYQNDTLASDDSVYSEETGCGLIELFKRCLGCKDE